MNACLCSINWNCVLNNIPHLSLAVAFFYEILFDAINTFVLKCSQYKNTFPNWYSTNLKNSYMIKNITINCINKQMILPIIMNFLDYALYTKLRLNLILQHINKIQTNFTHNPKSF